MVGRVVGGGIEGGREAKGAPSPVGGARKIGGARAEEEAGTERDQSASW